MIATEHIRRVVVRVPNWVGDVIHSLPALNAIREHFLDSEIVVLARGEVGPLLIGYPAVDRIISYPKQRAAFLHLWRVSADLRSQAFDIGIVLTNAFEGALIFFLAGIPRRYGYATDGRQWLLTDPIPPNQTPDNFHQTNYFLALLSSMGIKPARTPSHLRPTAAERLAAHERLLTEGWCPGRPLVALCPGASYGSAKRWPTGRFASLAKKLIATQQAMIVLLGSPGERGIGYEIAGLVRAPLLNLVGRTTLRQAMALLEVCNLAVSNDSGLLHLAVAVGTPSVALFGPTDPSRTGPNGRIATLIRKPVGCSPCEMRECPIDHLCMDQIEVDEVYEAVVKKLSTESHRRTATLV